MRYTTIIDITEVQEVYRNANARLLYLHMVLRSGYHDNDRDMLSISIRTLAMRVGISVAATRHALKLLERQKLISKVGGQWLVKKWIIEDTISPRAKTKKQQKAQDTAQVIRQQQAQLDTKLEQERRERQQLEAAGKSSYMVWYEAQIEKANQGDQDAAAKVERYRKDYLEQCEMMKKKANKEIK